MNSIRREYPHVLWYGCSQWNYDNDCEQRLLTDIADSNLTLDQFFDSNVILSFLDEGHCPVTTQRFVDYLIKKHPKCVKVIYTPWVDVNDLHYEAACFPTITSNHGAFFDNMQHSVPTQLDVNRKFLMLCRRPSISRAMITSQIIRKVGLDNMYASFGSLTEFPAEIHDYRHLFDVELPLTLDGPITNANANKIYNVSQEWYHCLFNIVLESASDLDPSVWQSMYVTEKTWKAYAMYQVPVWWAVPGLVKHIRNLGFDMFDDLIDHSYDNILDPGTRMTAVIAQVTNLAATSLAQCKQLRLNLMPRLQDNYKRLVDIKNQAPVLLRQCVDQFAKDTQ